MSTAPISVHGHRPELFTGQRGAILRLLLDNRGIWVPVFRLSALALQYNARVKELRDAGYTIENRTSRRGKQVLGEFRLTACPGETPSLFAGAVQ
jgi:hypothetical protein